jgi:hypothetical protein
MRYFRVGAQLGTARASEPPLLASGLDAALRASMATAYEGTMMTLAVVLK